MIVNDMYNSAMVGLAISGGSDWVWKKSHFFKFWFL